MRLAAALLLAGCANHHHGTVDAAGDGGPTLDVQCVGLQCFQVDCTPKGLPPTTISGTVYAPNGTLPLYGVNVYVPGSDPGPLTQGVTCARCSDGLAGGAIVQATTDTSGHFTLANVPATTDVPLVIQVGKWRRQLKLPQVAACDDLPLPAVETTLPKSRTDLTPLSISVDMPQIAISTGGADALECLMLKLGIDPKEITTSSGGGRVQLFADIASAGVGATKFVTSWPGGSDAVFADSSSSLWNSKANLDTYDISIFSCEGDQYPLGTDGTTVIKSQADMDAVKAYTDGGGRLFLSHWHNVWIEGSTKDAAQTQAPAVWTSIATWNDSGTTFNSPPNGTDPPDIIDEVNNPKGPAFASWMLDPGVGGSTVRDQIDISAGKQTATGVDNAKAERWVYWTDANNVTYPQNFQFTTPNEADPTTRCGKVVFSDMHVSSGSRSKPNLPYPSGCACEQVNGQNDPLCTKPKAMTPQEKALAFMFFDIASCVGPIQ